MQCVALVKKTAMLCRLPNKVATGDIIEFFE